MSNTNWDAPRFGSVVETTDLENPGLMKFNDIGFCKAVVNKLNKIVGEEGKWGLNGKRGDPNDLSRDCIARLNSYVPWGCSIVDIIGGHADNDPNANVFPVWIDQTRETYRLGTKGVFVPVVDSNPTPVPPPSDMMTVEQFNTLNNKLDALTSSLHTIINGASSFKDEINQHTTSQAQGLLGAMTSEADRVVTEVFADLDKGNACKVRSVLRG